MNRWVDPSFSDLAGESFSLSGRRKGSQASGSTAKSKRGRKRKGETGSPDPFTSCLLKDFAQSDQDEPWVDRYLPRSQVSIGTDTYSGINGCT